MSFSLTRPLSISSRLAMLSTSSATAILKSSSPRAAFADTEAVASTMSPFEGALSRFAGVKFFIALISSDAGRVPSKSFILVIALPPTPCLVNETALESFIFSCVIFFFFSTSSDCCNFNFSFLSFSSLFAASLASFSSLLICQSGFRDPVRLLFSTSDIPKASFLSTGFTLFHLSSLSTASLDLLRPAESLLLDLMTKSGISSFFGLVASSQALLILDKSRLFEEEVRTWLHFVSSS
mmetsp:Transcript_3912/g.7892  ORF Transcript_3912/g.7892 Transcript_3912/m.7892 type:complete len:238 (-) Transcript_3912:2065-2778(-)